VKRGLPTALLAELPLLKVASDEKAQILQQQSQGFTQLQSVAGGIGEEESALSSSEASLDSSAASRAFSSFSRAVSFFSRAVSFLIRVVSLLSRSDSCLDSIALICASIVGCQFNLANQRRQGGKEERNSDLLINPDAGMGGDVDMAVGSEEGDQDHQAAGQQSRQAGLIQPRDWLLCSEILFASITVASAIRSGPAMVRR
jgi:hypothetical protein